MARLTNSQGVVVTVSDEAAPRLLAGGGYTAVSETKKAPAPKGAPTK